MKSWSPWDLFETCVCVESCQDLDTPAKLKLLLKGTAVAQEGVVAARELVRLGHLEHLEAIHTLIRILSPLHLRIEAVGPHSDINEIRNRRQTFSRRSNSRLENYKRVTVLGYVWTIGKTFAANPESNINISAMGQRGRASHAVDGVCVN